MIITYTKERGREELKAGGKQKKSTYHRLDGPAIEKDGHKAWYEDGMRHRVDGPAIEWLDGRRSWYIEGIGYYEKNYNKLIQEIKDMPLVLRLIDPRKWVREFK